MAALAAVPSINARPNRLLTRLLVAVMFVAFWAVIAVRAGLTEEIEVNRENQRYLVGFHLTNVGDTTERNCMVATNTQNLPHLPRYELIKCAGQTYIPAMFGTGYTIVSVVYLISCLLFLGIFVLLVGGFSEAEGQTG
ncbi:MAG: hypothetical protein WB660_00170 [Candidatus Sulfotelmatobacter sp.]